MSLCCFEPYITRIRKPQQFLEASNPPPIIRGVDFTASTPPFSRELLLPYSPWSRFYNIYSPVLQSASHPIPRGVDFTASNPPVLQGASHPIPRGVDFTSSSLFFLQGASNSPFLRGIDFKSLIPRIYKAYLWPIS